MSNGKIARRRTPSPTRPPRQHCPECGSKAPACPDCRLPMMAAVCGCSDPNCPSRGSWFWACMTCHSSQRRTTKAMRPEPAATH